MIIGMRKIVGFVDTQQTAPKEACSRLINDLVIRLSNGQRYHVWYVRIVQLGERGGIDQRAPPWGPGLTDWMVRAAKVGVYPGVSRSLCTCICVSGTTRCGQAVRGNCAGTVCFPIPWRHHTRSRGTYHF